MGCILRVQIYCIAYRIIEIQTGSCSHFCVVNAVTDTFVRLDIPIFIESVLSKGNQCKYQNRCKHYIWWHHFCRCVIETHQELTCNNTKYSMPCIFLYIFYVWGTYFRLFVSQTVTFVHSIFLLCCHIVSTYQGFYPIASVQTSLRS